MRLPDVSTAHFRVSLAQDFLNHFLLWAWGVEEQEVGGSVENVIFGLNQILFSVEWQLKLSSVAFYSADNKD